MPRSEVPPIMRCGHAATGRVDGQFVCAACIGLNRGATQPMDPQPNLEGRRARCRDYGSGSPSCTRWSCGDRVCRCERPSSPALPFFQYHPDREFDSFYCGCWGWD